MNGKQVMKTTYIIRAELTREQLNWLVGQANSNGIVAEISTPFMSVGTEEEVEEPTSTPITGAILEAVATAINKSILEVAQLAASYEIETVEQAIAHGSIPSSVKEILEGFL